MEQKTNENDLAKSNDKLVEQPVMSKLIEKDEEDDSKYAVEEGSMSPLSIFLGFACFPLVLPFSWFTVQEKHEAVILNFGKYSKTINDPGCHFSNCCGRDIRMVSKQKISVLIQKVKILDLNGNPLLVSGIVVYYIENTKRAAIDVQNSAEFVHNQATAVLRQVVSHYPYEHMTEDAKGPTLKSASTEISEHMVKLLQTQVKLCGARIVSFQFDEISYAPEIASGMLKKQQATAMVAARKTIVDGAVDIAFSAISKLERRGVTMNDQDKSRITGNLLVVICSEQDAKPVINV